MYHRDLLYAILLLISALASVITMTFIWGRRSTPGARPLFILMLGAAEWSLTYAIHWIMPDLSAKDFWLDTTFVGAVVVPTSFLVFTLVYTHRESWIRWQSVVLLSVIPVLTVIILWTDPYHGLFFAGKRPPDATFFHDGGPWFWIYITYAYLLILFGLLLLIHQFFSMKRLYRNQVGMVLLAALLPWGASILSLTNFNPFPQLDLPPLAFVLTGILLTVNLLQGRFLDIVPVARNILVENMSDSVLVLDTQNRIVDINPAAQSILEDIPDQLVLGRQFNSVFSNWIDVIAQFQGVLEKRAEVRLEENPPRYFDVQINPLYDHHGRFSGRLITWRDVSERKRVEMEREQLIADLDAYAHTVAHDLKVPVSAIIGFAELLLEEDEPANDADLKEILTRIHQASYKVHTIINELLLLASIRDVTTISAQPLRMQEIIQETIIRLDRVIKDYGAQVTYSNSWPEALGHAPWIEEIWMNYISNAIKYGGRTPVIELDARMMPDGTAQFRVRDNGQGISRQDQEKLFNQFERLDTMRAEGHGLGLSIVRRIVEKLGGEVGVESEIGQGSTFYFTLPLKPTTLLP
jgi:signal transduction histidine kinase